MQLSQQQLEKLSMTDLSDQFLVGGPGAGADFLQNMYGMYVRHDQLIGDDGRSNIELAVNAFEHVYKPIRSTSMMITPAKDNVDKEKLGQVPTSALYLIRRDWKDALVQTWKQFAPEMTWEEFKDSSMGFSMVAEFESAISDMAFHYEISYEELVAEPQRVFTEFVHDMLPQEDNSNTTVFGTKKRVVNFDIIDLVVQQSQIRELREWNEEGFVEKVGAHKMLLTSEQAEEVDEFVASL